jgi:hypothetical protein
MLFAVDDGVLHVADLDHPGINNALLKVSCSSLAIRYNDQSILENHHCCILFSILSRDECNLFSSMASDVVFAVRASMIALIMSTDLGNHKSHMAAISAIDPALLLLQQQTTTTSNNNITAATTTTTTTTTTPADVATHRQSALCGLIKCADLANEVRSNHA